MMHTATLSNLPPALAWYAVWVLANAEFVVEDALKALGIESFLPTWNEVTQWSDRKKTIARPLFPGYLFFRTTAAGADSIIETAALPSAAPLAAVRSLAGVVDILPSSMNPLPVDARDIENIRRALASGLPVTPCDYVRGDAVEIEHGPLAGVTGMVLRTKQATRVIVRIEMLSRAVSVEIEAKDLVKAERVNASHRGVKAA